MLVTLSTNYPVTGYARSGEIYYVTDTVDNFNAPVDADNTALSYDTARLCNNRSHAGVVRAWTNVWYAPGVSAN